MDPTSFDRIATFFAERRLSRRHALRHLGMGGLAAGLVGTVGTEAATAAAPAPIPPAAGPIAISRSAETGALAAAPAPPTEASKPVTFMFAQSFDGGSLVPVPGKAGRYTLTLPHGLGQTIYFSDRPQRIVGVAPTPQFLKGLGFTPANPPNAVLIGHQGPAHEDLVVVELFTPRYDTTTNTATYEAQVLQDTHKLGLEFTQTPDEEAKVARTYTDAHLFIDDCPDLTSCGWTFGTYGPLPGGPVGQCWNWSAFACLPCNGKTTSYYDGVCNSYYPNECGGVCHAQ